MHRKLVKSLDRLTTGALLTSGFVVALIAFAIFYYLAVEGSSAFNRKFTYGFRFAGWAASGTHEPLETDPQATVLASSPDSSDGLDEKEDGITMPTLSEVSGVANYITGSVLPGAEPYYTRDNWVESKHATKGQTFKLFLAATPEHQGDSMRLAWSPDIDFDPKASPYSFTLKLVKGPQGFKMEPIDLKAKPQGDITLPAAVAQSDEQTREAYEFELVVGPASNNAVAAIRDFFSTTWAPLVGHQRFGVMPLLISTLLMTLIALLIAFPVAVACAVYLREMAPPKLNRILKPTIELMASVPTVVLGYFGLMMVAPQLQALFARALNMESGRSLLTASVMLGVLLIPILTTLIEDALDRLPTSLRDAVDGLGLTHSEALLKVLLPAAKGGLIGAVMFGFGRAIGETMILWMLSGGTAVMPKASPSTLGAASRGMADTIGIEMGNVDFGGVHYGYLFLLGLTLFLVTLLFNMIGYRMIRRATWRA